MRSNGSFSQQLVLSEIVLVPGGEWAPRLPGWSLIYVTRGVGYWMHPRVNHELSCGSVLLLSHQVPGSIRSSRLGELALQFFCAQPEKLSGIVTLAEQKSLEDAARNEAYALRLFTAAEPLAEDMKRACEGESESGARLRLQWLDLFLRAVGPGLGVKGADPGSDDGAKARLETFLGQIYAADMLELTFGQLAAQVGCCPRHLGRIFQEVVGMSFRAKQAQVRLVRAQELLATTKSKVVDVALESGYQSLSLFNFMFKRRFNVTPAQWRQQANRRKLAA